MPDEPSATPLARKLAIKPGHRLALLGAPSGWQVPDLPAGVSVVRRRTSTPADVLVVFCRTADEVRDAIGPLGDAITTDGSLWVAWPRRAGGHTSDVTDHVIRGAALALGLVDDKVAMLDEDWSSLKLVWRLEGREDRRR